MKNRYEQTMLTLSTFSHFDYKNFDHVVIRGNHCSYIKAIDQSGESVMGKMIYEFIQGVEKARG